MRQAIRRPLALLLVLALAAPFAAAATLKLKNGTSVTGQVSRYDSATKTVFLRTDDGKDMQLTIDQLDGRSTYLVNASIVPKDDAKAQMLVGNFARDVGLYQHALRRYGDAAKLDPSLEPAIEAEVTKLKRSAAELCMTEAQKAISKGDSKGAEKWLTILVEKLPGEPEAQRAGELLQRHYAVKETEAIAKAEAKATDDVKKDAANGKKHYERMIERAKQGLQEGGSSKAQASFRSAIQDGQAALKEIARLEKKYDDPQVREVLQTYHKSTIDQMVDLHLHLASALSVQSDYKGALKACNEALALDPKNQAALSARARIEEYSSRGIGWGWR
jgi:tetratricopeptide (TPR) repeat protein